MERADITDILRERWLRRRNSGELVWKTKNGDTIVITGFENSLDVPIKDLSDDHIENIINNDNKRWHIYDYGEEDL